MSEEWRVQVAEEASYQPGGFLLTWPEQELALSAPERERDTEWDLFGPRRRPGESAVVPLGVGHASRVGAPRAAVCGGDDPAFLSTSFATGARYGDSGGRAVCRVRGVARAWAVVAGAGSEDWEFAHRREAEATGELRRALSDRDDIFIPEVIENLTTERLLVMELAKGVKITDTEALVEASISPREVAYDSIEYRGRVRGMIYVHNRHRSYLHGVLQYEDMGGSLMSKVMFKASRFPCGVSDVMVVLLLCLIVCLILLSLPARGSQDPSALGMNHMLPVQRATVNAPSLDGSYYPFALAEEAEDEAVNAGLLTILFLAASFLGASLGWLLTNAQRQGALRFSSLGVGEVLGSAREEYLPFLGVFRL